MTWKRPGAIGFFATFFSLIFGAGLLLWSGKPVQAAPGVRYVAPNGNCGGVTPCYGKVQVAVDAAAPGDEIRIAAGTYMGVNNQGGHSQAVYIDKNLTIRGGYTTANWTNPDPETNVTEINATTLGRVVYITGAQTVVTLDGLHLIYGDSTGLGGHQPTIYENYDAGGGIYIHEAKATIDQCTIGHNFSPSNGYGGGIYLRSGTLDMTDTIVEENEAGSGGGAYSFEAQTEIGSDSVYRLNRGSAIYAHKGSVTLIQGLLEDNQNGGVSTFKSEIIIEDNVIRGTVEGSGVHVNGGGTVSNNDILSNEHAGLIIADGDFVVENNEIAYNQGTGYGDDPGVTINPVFGGDVTLHNNHIHHNGNTYSACNGAGVYINTGPDGLVTLAGNLIENNFAGEDAVLPSHGYGGGVYMKGDNIYLEGNIIRGNTAYGFIWAGNQYWGGHGGGVYINDSPTLVNNIIAGNTASFDGSGIYVNGGSPELIHNTIVQNGIAGGDGVGLYVKEDSYSNERSQVQVFNAIIVNQTIGIYAPGEVAENIVTVDGLLWSGNGTNTEGTGTFFLSHEYTGNPDFVDVANGDYHIGSASKAIDKGLPTTVNIDIDGEPRLSPRVDLGADEYWGIGVLKQIHLPLILGE